MSARVFALTAILLAVTGYRALPQDGGHVSDAMVLLQPGASQSQIAVVFPKVVSHSAVKRRLERLSGGVGATLSGLELKDEALTTNARYGDRRTLAKQTEASATLVGGSLERDGAFVLQPIVGAFSDLRRIEILYMLPPDSRFRGLRSFDSRTLAVRLVHEGGPYQYVVDYREHDGSLPQLPLTQPPAGSIQAGQAGPAPPQPSRNPFLIVVAIAAAAGLVALTVLFLLGRGNTSRPGTSARRAPRR